MIIFLCSNVWIRLDFIAFLTTTAGNDRHFSESKAHEKVRLSNSCPRWKTKVREKIIKPPTYTCEYVFPDGNTNDIARV